MDVIFIDGTETKCLESVIKNKATKIMDLRVATPSTLEVSVGMDYLIISEELATKITKIHIDYKDQKTISDLYNKLKKIYKDSNVIVLLEKGILYVKETALRILPYLNSKINDYFFGAFTYGIANKYGIEKSLKYANIVNSYSIVTKDDVPSLKEVEVKYASLK